jgi:hypothetical protein
MLGIFHRLNMHPQAHVIDVRAHRGRMLDARGGRISVSLTERQMKK